MFRHRLPFTLLLAFFFLLGPKPACAENSGTRGITAGIINVGALGLGAVTTLASYVALFAPWNDASPSTVSRFELVAGPLVAMSFGVIVAVPVLAVGHTVDVTARAIHRRFFSERARLRARLPSALRRSFPSLLPSQRGTSLEQWR